MATDWSKLTVVELRAALKQRGLPQSGKKIDFVRRLAEAEESEVPGDDEAVTNEQPATVEAELASKDDQAVAAHASIESAPAEQVHEPVAPTGDAQAVMPDSSTTPRSPEVADAPRAESKIIAPTSTKPDKLADYAARQETTALATVPASSEMVQDAQTRKRRSRSPEVQSGDAARKRARMSDNRDHDKGSESVSLESATAVQDGTTAAVACAETIETADLMHFEVAAVEEKEMRITEADRASAIDTTQKEEASIRRDDNEAMYKAPEAMTEDSRLRQDEGGPAIHENSSGQSYMGDNDGEAFESDRLGRPDIGGRVAGSARHPAADGEADVSPSLHPATSALYIRNFSRPLKENALRDYLVELATPPTANPDPDTVVECYLDQIRTHAFVQFSSTAAASRARIALHGKVWPDERNRKELWVDFIPSENVAPWIEQEADAGQGRGNMKRWEVIYEPDEDGIMTAALVEAGPDPVRPAQPLVQAAATPAPGIPTGPAQFPGIEAAPRGPRGGNSASHRDAAGEVTSATRARPSLLYKPASQDVVERRLTQMRSYYTKDRNRDMGRDDEINRYTFEDVVTFVDRGKEVFVGIRPPHREKERQDGRRGPPVRPAAGDHYFGTGSNRETSRGEAPRGEAYPGEAPRGEAYRGEAPRGEAYRGEAPRGEAPRGEAYRGEAPRGEAYRGEAPRGEAYRGEAYRGEAPRGEAYRGEAPRGEAYRGEAPRGEAFRGEAPRGEAYRGEAPRGEAYRGEAPRGEAYRGEAHRGEAYRGEAGREVNRSRFTGEPLPSFNDYRPDHRGGGGGGGGARRSNFRSDWA
ncbi:hypothetical protein P8C59_005558 [Phyllachora maydis]|uniref:SAP domain-containing protein n=1 Tax=Phyllachora maydis TaxID=1825666 RepID=A0AAD9I4P5_9PEZI|nr:hypothetical protein P8C59_005558 [Phyllachora maydis]